VPPKERLGPLDPGRTKDRAEGGSRAMGDGAKTWEKGREVQQRRKGSTRDDGVHRGRPASGRQAPYT